MRKEIVQEVKSRLSELLDIDIFTYEPDWKRVQKFPLSYISIGIEEPHNGLPDNSYRIIPISIFVVNRKLREQIQDAQFEIYDLIDLIDENLTNYKFSVGGKEIRMRYDSTEWTREILDTGHIVIASEIRFLTFMRR